MRSIIIIINKQKKRNSIFFFLGWLVEMRWNIVKYFTTQPSAKYH